VIICYVKTNVALHGPSLQGHKTEEDFVMSSTIQLSLRSRSLRLHCVATLVAAICTIAPAANAASKVNVLYAGSLVNLMEHGI
jgi:hypothetical protein